MGKLRSIGAVAAGYLTWGVLCVGLNQLLMLLFPSFFNADGGTFHIGMTALLLVLTFGYSIVAGYVTAVIGKSMRIVYWLAGVNLVMGIIMQTLYWDAMLVWYHVIFLAMVPMHTLLGGLIRTQSIDFMKWSVRALHQFSVWDIAAFKYALLGMGLLLGAYLSQHIQNLFWVLAVLIWVCMAKITYTMFIEN